jgi:2-pyrone-4,6-dicarboxylate lactonase
VAARAADHGRHVQFYPHHTDIIDYAEPLLALPNTIVLDMLDSGRVWVKLSAPMRCTERSYPYPEVTPLAARWFGMRRSGSSGAATGRT